MTGTPGQAAGVHLGFGPGSRGGGLLIGGALPLAGERQFKYLQLAPFLYPSEVCWPSGRALRTSEGIALPPLLAVDCARADDALASAWIDDARAELASVPAFLRLAAELNAVGAPAELRSAALAAAVDERHHAQAAFAMASRWAQSPFAVAPLDAQPRFDRASESALTQLAIEAWQDGCLGEGTAALCARLGLARVRDNDAAQVLARIAPDEERHADLSWRILEWCSSAGGAVVRDAVAEVAPTSAPAQYPPGQYPAAPPAPFAGAPPGFTPTGPAWPAARRCYRTRTAGCRGSTIFRAPRCRCRSSAPSR